MLQITASWPLFAHKNIYRPNRYSPIKHVLILSDMTEDCYQMNYGWSASKNNRITYGFVVQTCLHIGLPVYPFFLKKVHRNQRYQDMQLNFNIFGIVLPTQTPFNILFAFLVVFSEA